MQTKSFEPRAWYTAEVERDDSWIQRLSAEEVDDFKQALVVARSRAKPLLEMTADDFPLKGPGKQALAQAIATTQGRWGMCLVKGFPVDDWSEADVQLAYWGMGLHMGAARTQNRASQVITDVRNAGASYKVKNDLRQ